MIEGLGQHGMVGSADQSLINLHDGLRQEFIIVREQYQAAIDKLEHLALASKDPLTNASGAHFNKDHCPQIIFFGPLVF